MNFNIILENEKQKNKRFISTARNAIMICMLACVLMLVLQFVISLFPLPYGTELNDGISNIIIYCTFMIVPFGLLSFTFKHFFQSAKQVLPTRNSPKKPFLYVTGTLGIGYLTNLFLSLVFTGFVERHALESGAAPQTFIGIALMYVSNAVLPAILEEWAFRGVICKNLLPYSKNGAIIISSLLFGLMHINPATIIFTFVIGVMLAICYEHTGSLKIPMLIHFINNALATTVTLFVDTDNPNDPLVVLPFFIMVTLMVLAIVAIVYYTRHGISKKTISLLKPDILGFKLSTVDCILCTVLNFGFIPLVIIYYFYYTIIYLF